MSFPISKAVLDQVFTRLSDDTDGFNATFNSIKSDYGITENMAIDFVGVGTGANAASKNFARANVSPKDWIAASAFRYPFMTLFADRSLNVNHQKFHLFSGPVGIGVNVFLGWRQGRVLVNTFESLELCVEEAMYQVFNRARNAFPIDQLWEDGVVYNGDIGMTPSRIEKEGESWQQLLAFRASFEVDQRGEV